MKVIATANGFYGSYRTAGDTFEVEDDAKASWFKTVKTEKAKKPDAEQKPDTEKKPDSDKKPDSLV